MRALIFDGHLFLKVYLNIFTSWLLNLDENTRLLSLKRTLRLIGA